MTDKPNTRLVLARNEYQNVPFACALCGTTDANNAHFVVRLDSGSPVCWDCTNDIEPVFALLTDVFHELCNTACNLMDVADGKKPYYVLNWDLPAELAYQAIDAAYPDADDTDTVLT